MGKRGAKPAPAKKPARRKAASKSSMYSKAKTADAYEAELSPSERAVVRALRAFVKEHAPHLREEMKWGGVAFIGNWIVCYCHALGTHVDFGFFKGVELKDPAKILGGEGKYLRHVKIRTPGDIRKKEFARLLKQAVALDR
jgi:hypothetical protein